MTKDDLRFVFVWLLLTFLFVGDPDIWDVLHNYVMKIGECK